MQNGDIINFRFNVLCTIQNSNYINWIETGYQGHQFGVVNVLHERPLAPLLRMELEGS